ncbi:hypothetical protein C815_01771 [Firmicutes bacterium M10-2]|nr:hypothetical protein C815_01771 [Firmicutes bacterium M10-2]
MKTCILIYDLDKSRAEHTEQYVSQLFDSLYIPYTIQKISTPIELMKYRFQVQLLFLDIDHEKEALSLGSELKRINRNCLIVLNSISSKQIFNGYFTQATYYMLDHVSYDSFEKFLKPIILSYFRDELSFYDPSVSKQRIYLKDILYFEFQYKTTYLYLRSGKNLKTPYPLHVWIHKLKSTCFSQCFKSLYVNLNAVIKVENNEVYLINNIRFPLSRKFKHPFLEDWKNYSHQA